MHLYTRLEGECLLQRTGYCSPGLAVRVQNCAFSRGFGQIALGEGYTEISLVQKLDLRDREELEEFSQKDHFDGYSLRLDLNSLPSMDAAFIEPMKCLAVPKTPDGPNWVWEIKPDGYRGVAVKNDGNVSRC